MEAQPVGEVFRYLMLNYDIPIGFEESDLDREKSDLLFETNPVLRAPHKMKQGDVQYTTTSQLRFEAGTHPITLYIEDGSVEDVFNEIIRQLEDYNWEISDDVVNIFPVKGRNKKFEELLGMNVKRFTFEKGETVDDITKKIMALPEFGSFLSRNKLKFDGFRMGMNFVLKAQYGRVIDEGMDFSNLTFRDLLNKVTKVKRGGWALNWRRVWSNMRAEPTVLDIDI